MSLFPEKESESVVQEIPETPTVPENLQEVGVTAVSNNFTGQVTDDSGKPMIQTSQNTAATITIPASQTTLLGWSKGKIENAITWLGLFWLRMIKKAFHFGKQVVVKS